MNTAEQPTCGNGLAENSILPAQLGKLIAEMVENLETHMKALDLTDKNSSTEFDAYAKLARDLQQAAHQLHVTTTQMTGYRDLPMGKHDEKAMTHPRVRQAFEKFAMQKHKLLSLLERTAERDNQSLDVMRVHQ